MGMAMTLSRASILVDVDDAVAVAVAVDCFDGALCYATCWSSNKEQKVLPLLEYECIGRVMQHATPHASTQQHGDW